MSTIKAYFERNYIYGQFIDNGNIEANPETYRVMYANPISLYQGVGNLIQIFCMNSDQKNIDVSNVTVQVGLFEPNTENELATLIATPIDSANGRVIVNFTPSVLAPLDFGMYEVAVTAIDQNNNVWPVYINDSYGSRLKASLSKGPVLGYGNAINLIFTDQTMLGVVSQQVDLTKRPMGSTLATLQISFNQYTGNILAQGTMVTNPVPNDWANISSAFYANISGNVFQNVSGTYALMRIVADGIDPNGWGNVSTANIANVIPYSTISI